VNVLIEVGNFIHREPESIIVITVTSTFSETSATAEFADCVGFHRYSGMMCDLLKLTACCAQEKQDHGLLGGRIGTLCPDAELPNRLIRKFQRV